MENVKRVPFIILRKSNTRDKVYPKDKLKYKRVNTKNSWFQPHKVLPVCPYRIQNIRYSTQYPIQNTKYSTQYQYRTHPLFFSFLFIKIVSDKLQKNLELKTKSPYRILEKRRHALVSPSIAIGRLDLII